MEYEIFQPSSKIYDLQMFLDKYGLDASVRRTNGSRRWTVSFSTKRKVVPPWPRTTWEMAHGHGRAIWAALEDAAADYLKLRREGRMP